MALPAGPCLGIPVRLSTCVFQPSSLWGQSNCPVYWTNFPGAYRCLYTHYYSVSHLLLLIQRNPFYSKGKPIPFFSNLPQKHFPFFLHFQVSVGPQACWVLKFSLPLSSKFAQGNDQAYIPVLGSIFIYFLRIILSPKAIANQSVSHR